MGREVIPPLKQTNSFPNKATWQATSHPSPPTSYPLPPTHSPQSDSTCTMRGKQLWQVYDEETVIGLQHGCGIQAEQLSFSVKSGRLPPLFPSLMPLLRRAGRVWGGFAALHSTRKRSFPLTISSLFQVALRGFFVSQYGFKMTIPSPFPERRKVLVSLVSKLLVIQTITCHRERSERIRGR